MQYCPAGPGMQAICQPILPPQPEMAKKKRGKYAAPKIQAAMDD